MLIARIAVLVAACVALTTTGFATWKPLARSSMVRRAASPLARMVAAPMKVGAVEERRVALDKTFKDCRANKEAALVSYITGGYPAPETPSSCCSPSRRAAPT